MSPGTAELVASILTQQNTRSARAKAAAIAVELLERDGLGGLARTDEQALVARLEAHGYEPARAAASALAAAFELGRRVAFESTSAPLRMASSADVAAWAGPRLADLMAEELWVLALDGQARLRAARMVAKGGLHGVHVRASDPLRIALRADASTIVLVHNHPGGDPAPSEADVTFTRAVAAAGRNVGVPLLDHVVVVRDDPVRRLNPSSGVSWNENPLQT